MTSKTIHLQSRLEGVDFLRGVVVFLMFFYHCAFLQARHYPMESGWPLLEQTIYGIDRIAPIILATFAFLLGFSVPLSKGKWADSKEWFLHILKRVLVLCVFSVLLFIGQFGPQIPEVFLVPGILGKLAKCLLVLALFFHLKRPKVWLFLGALGVWGLHDFLEIQNTVIRWVNSPASGWVPILCFAFLGALAGAVFLETGRSKLYRVALGSGIGALFLSFLVSESWVLYRNEVFTQFGPNSSTLLDWWNFSGKSFGSIQISYWVYRPLGTLAYSLLLFLNLGIALGLSENHRVRKIPGQRMLRILGRHSLIAYVAHLVLLAVFELSGVIPPNAFWVWILLLALTLGISAALFGYEKHREIHPATHS